MISDLVVILALMKVPGVGPARIRKALAALRLLKIPLGYALSEGREVLGQVGIKVPDLSNDVRQVAEELEREGVRCFLTPFDELHPSPFAAKYLPPVLFVRGRAQLLSYPSVGFCGSRAATERGLHVAADIAEQMTQHGVNVVSGGAKGVDSAAHVAALAHGGTTVIVAAEGILQYAPKMELRAVMDESRCAVVSEFFPTDRWLAGRAMQRNHTICALSRALVLVEARAQGGTFAAGEAALKMGLPLFSIHFAAENEANDGNRILLSRGAVPLRQSKTTNRAKVERLLGVIQGRADASDEAPPSAPSPAKPQAKLFDGDD